MSEAQSNSIDEVPEPEEKEPSTNAQKDSKSGKNPSVQSDSDGEDSCCKPVKDISQPEKQRGVKKEREPRTRNLQDDSCKRKKHDVGESGSNMDVACCQSKRETAVNGEESCAGRKESSNRCTSSHRPKTSRKDRERPRGKEQNDGSCQRQHSTKQAAEADDSCCQPAQGRANSEEKDDANPADSEDEHSSTHSSTDSCDSCKFADSSCDSCEEPRKKKLVVSKQRKQKWFKIAVAASVFTILYNIIEGVLSIVFGAEGESLALLGFGIDSFLEVTSAILVFVHLVRGKTAISLRSERITTGIISVLVIMLGLGTMATSIYDLVKRNEPETTLPGTIITGISLVFMWGLYLVKRRGAKLLDSATLKVDSKCTLGCIKLSCVVFAGSLIFLLTQKQSDSSLSSSDGSSSSAELSTIWWIDAAAALTISLFIAVEGINSLRNVLSKDFAGGCGCADDKPSTWYGKVLHYVF